MQPSVSLSESRVSKTEDLCENEAMKLQFRVYAESVLMNNRNKEKENDSMKKMEKEMEMEAELGSEIEEVNESLLSWDPLISSGERKGKEVKASLNGKDGERLSFSNGNEWKLGKSVSEMENQSESDQNGKEFEGGNHPYE